MDLCQLRSRRRLAALAAHLPLSGCRTLTRPPPMDRRVVLAAPLDDCSLYRSAAWGDGPALLRAALRRGGHAPPGAPGEARGAGPPALSAPQLACLHDAAAAAFAGSRAAAQLFGGAEGARGAAQLEGAWAAGAGLLLDGCARAGRAGPALLEGSLEALARAEVMADLSLFDCGGRLLLGRCACCGGLQPGGLQRAALARPAPPCCEAGPAPSPSAPGAPPRRAGVELWRKEDPATGLPYFATHFIPDASGGCPRQGCAAPGPPACLRARLGPAPCTSASPAMPLRRRARRRARRRPRRRAGRLAHRRARRRAPCPRRRLAVGLVCDDRPLGAARRVAGAVHARGQLAAAAGPGGGLRGGRSSRKRSQKKVKW
jgi:hypothetical protein